MEKNQTAMPTPTASKNLPPKIGTFATVPEALDYAAKGEAGFNFYDVRGNLEKVLPYKALRLNAQAYAQNLLALGLKRGEKVGIIADMRAYFLEVFFACQYAGLMAVPLPVITGLGGRHGYEQQLHTILKKSEAKAAIGLEETQLPLKEASKGLNTVCLTPEELQAKVPQTPYVLQPLGPTDESHIQFSSGSTREPKGVVISQKAMLNNAAATIGDGLKGNTFGRVERVTSWLPLYHDMGLVGCMLTPLCCQFSVDFLHTDSFARSPLQWLKLIAKNRSTISYGPTFAYDICARRVARLRDEKLDLSSWRVAGIGGEMVHPQTLKSFAQAFKEHGFEETFLTPSYGLAEATLAVSFSPVGRGLRTDAVQKNLLAEDKATPAAETTEDTATTRVFASCGVPLTGYSIKILDEHNQTCAARTIGRICLKTPSLMTEYFKEPEMSAEMLLEDGWLDTGDMGYLADGELFITGRKKDMIIIKGKNIWPQDMEWHAENNVESLRSRDTAAFSIENALGKEEAVLLVQTRTTDPQKQLELRKEVQAAVYQKAGVDAHIILVPQRSLPYTTSGKLSRAKAKKAYLEGTIKPLEIIEKPAV